MSGKGDADSAAEQNKSAVLERTDSKENDQEISLFYFPTSFSSQKVKYLWHCLIDFISIS